MASFIFIGCDVEVLADPGELDGIDDSTSSLIFVTFSAVDCLDDEKPQFALCCS